VASALRRIGDQSPIEVTFFPRERQILLLLTLDQSRREIADYLGVSESTVKNHVHRVRLKLNEWLRGRSLAVWADQHPEAIVTGFTRNPQFHEPGCLCSNDHCARIRARDYQQLLAA